MAHALSLAPPTRLFTCGMQIQARVWWSLSKVTRVGSHLSCSLLMAHVLCPAPPTRPFTLTLMESYYLAFQDGRGVPAFSSHSMLNNGWLYDANGNILFWVPPMNRGGLYYPQTTMVIGAQATQVDLSHFVHGEHWTGSCSS
ncbi:hypothetical protein HD554DRAFT_2188501 [Boletus coccyginus]|nr:hypothetical protein HD554DRAFT_2188501 [Boletus coccyginus]